MSDLSYPFYRLYVDDAEHSKNFTREAKTLPAFRKLYRQTQAEVAGDGRDAWIKTVRVKADGGEVLIDPHEKMPRGGKIEGAGRKRRNPSAAPAVTVSARVEPDLKAFVRKQPEGESQYIRNLISRAEIESRIF